VGEWADRLTARIMDRIENEADAIGVEVVAIIRERINVPVQRIEDPSGGVTIERSAPGEPPRREFGELWAAERHDVATAPNLVILSIINDCPYAKVLHFGGTTNFGAIEPRPFHYLPSDLGATEIKQRIHDAILGKR
jgi:hypothetical protein